MCMESVYIPVWNFIAFYAAKPLTSSDLCFSRFGGNHRVDKVSSAFHLIVCINVHNFKPCHFTLFHIFLNLYMNTATILQYTTIHTILYCYNYNNY